MMKSGEKKYATSSPEEDFIFTATSLSDNSLSLRYRHYIIVTLMSVIILSVYLLANTLLYPSYPVINGYAEQKEDNFSHYPPFRMNEWTFFSASKNMFTPNAENQLITDNLTPGFPAVAAPLISKFGKAGIYYTNAFILWLSALLFYSISATIVSFPAAVIFTFIFAFASPNFFFAASGYPEPLTQLFIILAFFLLVKGYINEKNTLYILSGFSLGLTLFTSPVYIFTSLFFAYVIIAERNTFIWKDTGILHFAVGLGISLIFFFVLGGSITGIFNLSANFGNETTLYDSYGGVLGQFWKLLFEKPVGIIYAMPSVVLVPLGLILMWRNKLKSICIVCGMFIVFAIFFAVMFPVPIIDETLSARQLVPIIPFFILPLIYIWQREKAEKVWLTVTLVMSLYICGTGWWIDIPEIRWLTSGAVHDNGSRYIILARSEKLKKPVFKSSNATVAKFFRALENNDIKTFLQTLDTQSLEGIRGQEREFFSYYSHSYVPGSDLRDIFIESVDADQGIHLLLPSKPKSIPDTLSMQNTPNDSLVK